MDRRRAAAALLALAACIACSSAAPTANDQTALEIMDGPTEGCYYNFQHYGEGDRIMTNEPCLNCTCHNRMLMCYLRVCPFTKPIGQDCTVEKRADQCCPIVTCPDVPVDLLTSTSTSSPAEYGTTGVGKLDKYGCSINGKYFSEGAKVPSTPNKPCEHCYCIRNMTTCVMQECTLHVDGCTPIYHKDVCCPVRYSCDHPEDEILLLDDMTTTVRPTPGFLLTTTTVMPVTQISQDCVHDNQIFSDGTLIKTEKACEHCYCMKGDIVCVVQECGTPMENEGKNCTSLPPRHGQCCPDTYICEGDDHGTELTTENIDQTTLPPRRVGVEGSGYRNEPDESFTEITPFETDIEGSGEDDTRDNQVTKIEDLITEKVTPDFTDEILLVTTEKIKISQTTEHDKDQNTIPDIISGEETTDQPDVMAQTTEANVELATVKELITTASDDYKTVHGSISKEDEFITTESAFRKEDNNIIADEILTVKEHEKLPTTLVDLVDETTFKDEHLLEVSTDFNLQPEHQSTTESIEMYTEDIAIIKQKETTTVDQSQSSTTVKIEPDDEIPTSQESSITTATIDKIDTPETTSVNPVINEVDDNIPITSAPGRIPGEGDCLLNGITYSNNTIVPSTNNCHTSCKCTSSIIKCDPIICSSPPEYMENMSDCQPIYDSPDACCPTYVCSAKETIPPQSHNQMSGTESPKPIAPGECSGQDCILDEEQKAISETPSNCTTVDCVNKSSDKQEQSDCGLNNCDDQTQQPPIKQDCSDNKCQVLPVVACEGDNCLTEPITEINTQKLPDSENTSQLLCNENGECKQVEVDCKDDICEKHEISETEVKAPADCTGPDCKTQDKPTLPPKKEPVPDFTTEQMAADKVTQISLTDLDVDTEYPAKTILPLLDENISVNPTTEVVNQKETDVTDEFTTVSETLTNDKTESPTAQSITEKTEISISTEKADTADTQPKDEDVKMTEQTSVEHDTEISELPDSKDKTTEEIEADRMSTEMSYHVTSESPDKNFEDNVTDKKEITTEKIGIYATVTESVTDKENEYTEPPKQSEIEIEKSTTSGVNLDYTEKDETIEQVSEIYGMKDETSSVSTDVITKVTEKTTIEFNEATEMYELPHSTNEPLKEVVEIEKEKPTEIPEIYKPQEEMTDDNRQAPDATQSTELYETKDDTDTMKITTESIDRTTEASVQMQTSQEIITEKHETYTESSEYVTTKLGEATSELSKQHEHTLATTQATEQPITEKELTFTESSETIVTKSEETTHEIVQPVSEDEEIHAETTEQLIKELEVTSFAPITEIESETTVTNKAITETIEPDTIEKQDTYNTEVPKIGTTSEESITKDYEIKQDIATELPTMISTLAEESIATIKITEEQDILTKETEKPAIEKDSHVSDDIIFETSTAAIGVSLTDKLNVDITESTPAQTITEKQSFMLPTSESNKVDELDYESHKLATTLKDSMFTQGITTEEVIEVTEKQTKSPLENEEKPQITSTEMQEKLTSVSIDNVMDTTTHQPSQEKDESLKTTSAYSTSQSEHTTIQHVSESQKINTMKESQSQLDSSTITSLFEDKNEESTDLNILKEEILDELTTSSPQDKQQEKEKDTTLLTESVTTLQDIEKTTVGLVPEEETETEPQSYVTESLITDLDTDKQSTAVIIDDQQYKTTEKTVAEEENLLPSTHKYSTVEDIAKEPTLQSSNDVSTEKTNLQDTSEISIPIEVDTTKPEMYTKFDESSTTEAVVDKQEKERVTELPDFYITPKESDSSPIQKEKLDETQQLTGSDEDNQPLTTPTTVQKEEEKTITTSPILLVTDIDSEKETIISEKNEGEMELTTKIYDDKFSETEKGHTMISDLYTTEPQTQASEIPEDINSQYQTISSEKIITTENPEYLSTSKIPETSLPALSEVEKADEQEITSEKEVHETDPVINLQTTPPELEILSTTFVAKEDETFSTEKEKTTVKSIVDIGKYTSSPPEYQTTILVPKEDITTELISKEISTIPPKVLDQEKDDFEVTELYGTTQQGPSTMLPEIHHHEMITEKEISTESFEGESHTITTIKPTVAEEENIEDDTRRHSSTENILTDKPTVPVTDSKESDVADQEHRPTDIPVFTEIHTLPELNVITEKHEKTETESFTEKIETTETQTGDQKDSSTESSKERTKVPEQTETDYQKLTTVVSNVVQVSTTNEFDTEHSQTTEILHHTEPTSLITDNKSQLDTKDELITSITEDASLNIETTQPTIPEKEHTDQPDIYNTVSAIELQTAEPVTQKETNKTATEISPTPLSNVNIPTQSSSEIYDISSVTEDNKQTTDTEYTEFSKTTSFLVELEEHTHSVVDEITTRATLEEIATTVHYEPQQPERGDQISEDLSTPKEDYQTSEPSKTTEEVLEVDKTKPVTDIQEEIDANIKTTNTPIQKLPTSTSTYESQETKKDSTVHEENIVTSTSQVMKENDFTTESVEIQQMSSTTLPDLPASSDKDISSEKPLKPIFEEKETSEFAKDTTSKINEETSTYSPSHITKPKDKPIDTTVAPVIQELPKPGFTDDINEGIPSPDFPPTGGYGQEPDYIDEDQAFGPGTCRYGGKVYVSAQQIPRDDPCDFCFCFRSDIICLQQSCPPPIHGCHEEPIQGFCCPRYECPVSMATTLNVTTTTTTTTTTLPPHFLPHAYKGAAQRRGCQIKGHTYKVGEVVRASSGPCLHCTCGGDGQMKCDPKACTPEPMLRQMIAAAVSAKRRR